MAKTTVRARCKIRVTYSKHQSGGMLTVRVEDSDSKHGYVNRTGGIKSVEDAKKKAEAFCEDLKKIDRFDFFEIECVQATESKATRKKAHNAEIDRQIAELEVLKSELEAQKR